MYNNKRQSSERHPGLARFQADGLHHPSLHADSTKGSPAFATSFVLKGAESLPVTALSNIVVRCQRDAAMHTVFQSLVQNFQLRCAGVSASNSPCLSSIIIGRGEGKSHCASAPTPYSATRTFPPRGFYVDKKTTFALQARPQGIHAQGCYCDPSDQSHNPFPVRVSINQPQHGCANQIVAISNSGHDTLRTWIAETVDQLDQEDRSLTLSTEICQVSRTTVVLIWSQRGSSAPVCIGGIGYNPLYEEHATTPTIMKHTTTKVRTSVSAEVNSYVQIVMFNLEDGDWLRKHFWFFNSVVQEDTRLGQSTGSITEQAVKDEVSTCLRYNIAALNPAPVVYGPWIWDEGQKKFYHTPHAPSKVMAVQRNNHMDFTFVDSHAEWEEREGYRLLCFGKTVASCTFRKAGELPGIYLIHPCCNDVIAGSNLHRSLFDCFRALGPVLHEEELPMERAWPWPLSCEYYGLIVHDILSDPFGNKTGDTTLLRSKLDERLKIWMRLEVFELVKKNLPTELVDSILDHLPFELALALERLSGGGQCLRRLRQDPIARRFELASQILGHKTRRFRHPENKIKLESEMVAEFVKLGSHWCLRDLVSAAEQDIDVETQSGKVERIRFTHSHDRRPWIAVQVCEYAITHIAFESEADEPKWLSPNAVDSKAAFFQDSGSAERFDSVVVISDGMKLCAVDIPQQFEINRTRAILPPGVSGSHWSLAPFDLLSSGLHVWTPIRPGMPGFHLSNEPRPGFKEIKFSSEGVPRTVALISAPPSPVVFVRFDDEVVAHPDTVVKLVNNVVGVWQFQFACNLVVASENGVGDKAVA
ncbi:hypothetical protein EK21DRAFT_94849 [Setomelanomma holmii]|uniref:Uncharacterized protein n=1 Tax=Setomelanomma holmii TaxID=210430 RepID=A0A9P4GWZ7_9PLEO|nr:hypothetical protein EK21DRAFT_94849 [Setomelanomma holmii]